MLKKYPRIKINCVCGCGAVIENRDRKGRLRKFVSGHNNKLRRKVYVCIYCKKQFFKNHYHQKYCNKECMAKAYTYKIDVNKIKDLYLKQLKSTLYIGKLLGIRHQTIAQHLKRDGIKLRPSGGNISRRIYSDKERLLNRRIYQHNRTSKCPELSLKILQEIYENNIKQYGTLTCYLCEKSIKFGQDSIDHKIPVSKGGTNERINLEIAHRKCNSSKFTKTFDEYKKGEKICR